LCKFNLLTPLIADTVTGTFRMSSTSTVGGAVGEIRAAIDEARFSDYIAVNVPEIVVPVEIRQFQVCASSDCGFQRPTSRSHSMDR